MVRRRQGASRVSRPDSGHAEAPLRAGRRGARRREKAAFSPSRLGGLGLGWLTHHIQAAAFSLGRIYRGRLGSLLTISVIGIALAMPASLSVLVQNARTVAHGWDSAVQLSVFMDTAVSDESARSLGRKLEDRSDIRAVEIITREQALDEFRRWSGYGDAVDMLDHNPLPALIVVQPAATGSDAVGAIARELGNMDGVAGVQLDQEWLERFFALLDIGQRTITAIAIFLALAVIVIIGNTIRLDILNQRHEIEVMKLVGATDAFIRRPFLYSGLWYGLLAGMLGWILVAGGVGLLSGPVYDLAALYESDYRLQGLPLLTGLGMAGSAMALGWAGSWLAVGRHLYAIEPR